MVRRCCSPAAAAVDVHKIGTPCGCSPRLLGVPCPIVAPCLLRPDATRDHAEGEQCHTDVNKLVGGGEILAAMPPQSPHCQEEGTTEDTVGEYIHRDVGHKPCTLQCRHQTLVVYLGIEDIDADEHCRHYQ